MNEAFEVLWLLSQQPLWLGFLLTHAGVLAIGISIGVWLR